MKKLMLFFLSLICLAANAQYYQGRTVASANQLGSLSYYGSITRFELSTPHKPDLKLPYFLTTSGVTPAQGGYALYSNPTFSSSNASDQGYWSGPKVSSSLLNGRFQAIQSFDIQGNLRESKATYQFKSRKKR